MATSSLHATMTADDLFERPDDGYRYELVDGGLVRMTPTGAEHGVVTARVAYVLQEYALHHGGVCCGARDRVRSAAFARRRSRSGRRLRGRRAHSQDGRPEVLLALRIRISPSRFSRRRIGPPTSRTKIADYFSAGTRLVWVVEPSTRSVRAYRSPDDVRVIREDGEITGGDVLPGFRCEVKRLFAS